MLSGQQSIVVNNLVKRYHKADRDSVAGISFEVGQGEFFALLGPNGAGKTTTISILTTTLSKSSGEVKVAGFDVTKEATQVRRHCGIIFQNPSLDKNLTAEENIRFHAILYGLYPFRPSYRSMAPDYRNKVSNLSSILGIESALHRPIKSFSGGMKRKLEILRSLMHEPDILFLDEPTAGLDPASRHTLWDYLKGINRDRRTTIFLTTHYLEEAEGADRICVIDHGKIVASGSVREIKAQLIDDYLLIDTVDRVKLRNEIRELSLIHEEGPEGFRIPVNGLSAQEIIQSIQTKLSLLQTHTPSLEDAYLEIIQRNSENV